MKYRRTPSVLLVVGGVPLPVAAVLINEHAALPVVLVVVPLLPELVSECPRLLGRELQEM